MDEQTLMLYEKSEKEDQELIKKLLSLYPLSYDELLIYVNKYKNKSPEIQGDLLALMSDYEKEFVMKILYQIPELSNELFLDLLVGIKSIDNEVETVNSYIKNEWNRIMAEWHKDNPSFDMPNGVIGLSVNDEKTFVKVGDNPDVNEDSLYDIASVTKLVTEAMLFRIIKEKKYGITFNTKLRDLQLLNGEPVEKLYPKLNLDITIRELISFNNEYRTDIMITDMTNREDALAALRTSYTIKEKEGEFLYRDLPIMILTDLLEQVTGKEYRELLNEYIIKPLDLHNTFMDLDENNQKRYTGLNKKGVNDPKSNIINGGGHAGIITDARDFQTLFASILTPGFIFDSDEDPMLFDMLGMNKTVNGKYAVNGKKLEEAIGEEKYNLHSLGVSEETIDKVIDQIQKVRESGVSVIGNFNVAAEGLKISEVFKKRTGNAIIYVRGEEELNNVIKVETHNLHSLGVSKDTIDEVIKQIKTPKGITPVYVNPNLRLPVEFKKDNFYVYDGVAPQIIPYKGFMVQGSTRVQGDAVEFKIDEEPYRTTATILTDIHNQYDNYIEPERLYLINIITKSKKIPDDIKEEVKNRMDTIDRGTLKQILSQYNIRYDKYIDEYYVEGKGMMKMADARKSGLKYYGGYFDKISNMLSIARIMEIYTQYKKLNKKKAR